MTATTRSKTIYLEAGMLLRSGETGNVWLLESINCQMATLSRPYLDDVRRITLPLSEMARRGITPVDAD